MFAIQRLENKNNTRTHTEDDLTEIVWRAVSKISGQELRTVFNGMFARCQAKLIVADGRF
jgi:hypothetical protein